MHRDSFNSIIFMVLYFGKQLYEVFKYIGVDVSEIGYNQPAGVRYPTENPFA